MPDVPQPPITLPHPPPQSQIIGSILKDAPQGSFAEGWISVAAQEFGAARDITGGLESALLSKDASAIQRISNASSLTVRLYRKVLKAKILEAVEADSPIKHGKLTEAVEKSLDKLPELGVKVDPSLCDLFM